MKVPSLVGIAVAWGGIVLLLSPAAGLLGPPDSMTTRVLEQLVMWVLLAAVVAIVVFWEKQPLASMGLRRFHWSSIVWGLALAAVSMYVVLPLLACALSAAGIPGFEGGMAKVLVLPLWFRVIAVVTAGVVEDSLSLGFAFTRLERLTGSTWAAGIITATAICLLHLPNWGWGPVLAWLVAAPLPIGFFIWRRDLLANIVAHVVVDAMGLVVMPALQA